MDSAEGCGEFWFIVLPLIILCTDVTMAQVLVGIWFLASLPRELRTLFFGDNKLATLLLLVGIAGGIGSILFMSEALHKENVRHAVYFVPGVIGVVILCMVVIRGILRDAYLKPYFHPKQFVTRTQWSVFPLFLVLFIAGVILWLTMLKRFGLLAGDKAAEQTPAVAPPTPENRLNNS